MPSPVDAAPEIREPDADRAPEAVADAPDDHQAAGLVQEESRHLIPDDSRRDDSALATRPAQAAPEAASYAEDIADTEKQVRHASSDATQQLGRQALDGAGEIDPEEPANRTTTDAVPAAHSDAELEPVEAETGDMSAQRTDSGTRAGSLLLRDDEFAAMSRPDRETATVDDAEVVEAAAEEEGVDAVGEDPEDAGGRSEMRTGDAEPLRVDVEEEAAAGDGERASAGDQPPAGNGGDGKDNNGGWGGKGPEEDGEPGEDEEPGDKDNEPEKAPTGRDPADAEQEQTTAEAEAGESEPTGDDAVSEDETAERDPLETLRAHRNLVGGIEKLLDEAIAREDEGATSATALELVTARDEMDRFIGDQIAAGNLTEEQVAAVQGEPMEDLEPETGDTTSPAERTTDTTTGDDDGDEVDIDLGDHLHPKEGEPSEHDRVMSELRERVDHANKMAERLTAARDAELIAGIPVDDWLVDAAADAAREAHEYYDRNDTLLNDIELGIYDTTDGNVHFSINPAIPEVGDTTGEADSDWDSPPPHYHPETLHEGDTSSSDTTTSKPERTHDSPPYWDESNWPDGPEGADPKKGGWDIDVNDLDPGSGPHGTGSERQEEVKALSGTIMEHIWNKLSSLHEKIVTNTENRTVERLRIVDGVMKVDLYKVSRVENTPLPSRYYLRTGHTGIRNGIFGGFREQKPVALKSVSGNHVHAAKILARQERRQEQLHHTRGSSGLMALATAVRTAYGAKADEHRARVIYRFEKSNFEFKQIQQRQHLKQQMQHTRYMRGAQREERRQEIRDELRRLRHEEHRFRQHHKSVKSQTLHRRAVRGTVKASGKAIKGTAKGSAWAAKKGAKGTAKVARRTTETAANRWAARQTGPGGSSRPPRNPIGRNSGRGPRRTPNDPPKTSNGTGNQQNSEDDSSY